MPCSSVDAWSDAVPPGGTIRRNVHTPVEQHVGVLGTTAAELSSAHSSKQHLYQSFLGVSAAERSLTPSSSSCCGPGAKADVAATVAPTLATSVSVRASRHHKPTNFMFNFQKMKLKNRMRMKRAQNAGPQARIDAQVNEEIAEETKIMGVQKDQFNERPEKTAKATKDTIDLAKASNKANLIKAQEEQTEVMDPDTPQKRQTYAMKWRQKRKSKVVRTAAKIAEKTKETAEMAKDKFKFLSGKLKEFAMKAYTKIMTVLAKLRDKVSKWMKVIAAADAFPPTMLIAPGDIPSFGAAGRQPWLGAKANVGLAEKLAKEATMYALFARRAADYAAAESASADSANGDAQAAKIGAENESYAYSMALSLNRYAKLVALAITGHETQMIPKEVKKADDIEKLTDIMASKSISELHKLQELATHKYQLDGKLGLKIDLVLEKVAEQTKHLVRVHNFALKHKHLVDKMHSPEEDPPFVARALLREDGTPWWPDKPPPVEMAPRMIMMKPKPGVWMRPTFL